MWDPPRPHNSTEEDMSSQADVVLISRNSSGLVGYNPKMRVINRSQKSVWWSGVLLLTLFLFSFSFADPLSQDIASKCTENQFTCHCGVPTCIEKSLVKDGEKDCADGSDEGQWDPSKCAIKNRTSEDIRFKRAAIPDFPRLVASDATTTFFGNERGRTRPVGLLSTSLGAFVTSGTTTEYLTKILGTYIKGTYARIISTSSRVYHAVPTEGVEIRPTGFVASALSTEINGYATTVHTTDYYRTYIDGTYAQLVSSSANVEYPSWYTEQIDPSATQGLYTSTPGVITPSSASDHLTGVYATALPQELRGNFVNNMMQSKAFAELGIVESGDDNDKGQDRIRALRPNNNPEKELRVTGTHGKFVHTDGSPGGETTYNVFTGSYIQNLKTFLFFFGNTVIDATKASGSQKYKATLMVENGPQRQTNVHVDMSRNLKVIVPSKNSRVMVDGSVNGEKMEGILVEIEGSEGSSHNDELITVDGAKAMGTPSDPRIDMITVTLGDDKKTRVSSSSSSSSSSKKDQDNEIPQGRKVPSDDTNNPSSYRLIRPSRTESISLPTFTVGQPDKLEFQDEVTTPRVVVNVERHVDSSKSKSRAGAPVFQKVTVKPVPRSTERIRALGYTDTKNSNNNKQNAAKSSKYSNMPNRNHRAFSGFDVQSQFNDVDSDLQSAASTGRATVTYVGFADFTTTVGNTVIVFMPRTKMIEDLSVHATKTESPRSPVVEPTRFVYQTDDDEATTQRHEDDDSEHVQFSVSHQQGRKVGSSVPVKINQDDEDDESTTEINPSESARSVSGRQTVFIGGKKNSKSVATNPEATPVYRSSSPRIRPSASPSVVSDRRNSLFSSPRVKFTPKSSRTVEPQSKSKEYLSSPVFKSVNPSAYQTASTAVFQTDVLNPTGLVTSVVGTIVRDGKTTLYTSLVFGTFIGKSYAQVIKSTSKVLKKSEASVFPSFSSSVIRPTPVAKFSTRPSSSVFTYEVATTTEGTDNDDEEGQTTLGPKDLDRMEVSVSSTTESSNKKLEDEIFERTTYGSVDLEDSFDDEFTTTTEKNQDDSDNEVRRRKVQGKAKDQIIVDADEFTLEATPVTPNSDDEEEQTIHVTRTLPTTVYRTYTYYTTYFIPKEDSTLTSVVSREVTSSAVGLVRKTFTSIIPTASSSDEVKPSKEVSGKQSNGRFKPSRGKVQPSGAQVIYKTLFTTYTYLTTFFSGHTSSVSSREETISNVQTVTSGIGSKATTSVKITPTGSLRSRSYKTASPRLSSAAQGGKTNVGLSSSPSSPPPRGSGRSSVVRRPKQSKPVASEEREVSQSASDVEYESVTKTLLKTFMTTYTYFTTLFNGDDTSIKSRTEVITNVVPYVTKTLAPIVPSASADLTSATVAPGQDDEEYEDEDENQAKDEFSSSTAFRMSNHSNKKVKETTFYTTYTYLSTIFQGKSTTVKTSKQTFTNVIIGDKTIRSGLIEPIEPTKLSGRSAGSPSKSATNFINSNSDDEDLNEVGSHLSETSETTVKNKEEDSTTLTPRGNDYYELESSEGGITTNRPHGDDDDDNDLDSEVNEKTPILRTLYTTFTFYTTFYKGGTSTVSSRLETKSQVVTDSAGLPDEDDVTVTENAALLSTIDPTFPVTYFTTYTYWTTSFKDGNSIVTSREETVTNVVTPGADEIAPSSSTAIKETENEIVPTSSQEVEQTTFYTTYTYFTTSYLGEKTIVNSRLETVTNVVTGTGTSVSPTQTGRAIGTIKPEQQKVTTQEKDEYQDYDLPTGLLSTVISTEVKDRTTTLYSTDVYGTYIDGIYAQVLESTSNIVAPTAAAETRFVPDATEKPIGVVSVNEGKTSEAGGDRTTFYATTAYGTLINGKYAHLVESTSSTKVKPGATLEASEDSLDQKTGLVRVIDGTLVEGDRTTFYTSSILGTFIDGNYAQVIESTSRYVISPTKSNGFSKSGATRTVVDIESSITESPQEDEETTTTSSSSDQEDEEIIEKSTPKKGLLQSKRFGLNRNRNNSRLSFTGASKTFTPAITPFASRSRPASGFVPRRRQSSAITVTKTDDVTPTITATPSGTTSARGFQSRRRFQKPGDSSKESPVGDGTTTPTPALPASRTRGGSRFSKPAIGVKSRFSSSNVVSGSGASITPTSASGAASGGSSPGARGRSSFAPRGSSAAGARGRTSAAFVPPVRGSSSAGFRGTGASSSTRFSPRGRGSSALINPSSTQAATVEPTQTSSLGPDEEEYEAEYEYEGGSSSTTTAAPKTTNRFSGGSNRFRLNPKLATPSVDAKTTTARPSTTRGAPNLRGRFSKPTLPTRGTTPAAVSSSSTAASEGADNAAEEYEEEYEEVKDASSTTSKPLRPGFGSGKRPAVVVTQRPTYKPTPKSRATTTNAPATTTTRKIYTPRPRPAGFPRAVGLSRSTTTSTTVAPLGPDEEYYEEGEFEYQETKNLPNITLAATGAASEISEVRVQPPAEGHDQSQKSLPSALAADSEGDLFGSSSDLIEAVLQAIPQSSRSSDSPASEKEVEDYQEALPGSRRRRALHKRSARQVDINAYYNYNFGARTARGTLRSNFPSRPSSSSSNFNSNSDSNSRSSTNSNTDNDYEYYYDDGQPALPPAPPSTTSAPSRSPSARFRGRIQPTSASATNSNRRTPFTLTPNTNTRTSSNAPSRTRTSSSNSRPTINSNTKPNTPSRSFIPTRRSQSRYQKPTESSPIQTTSRTSRFRNRYNSRDAVTTPAPVTNYNSRSRFGNTLTRSRGPTSARGYENVNEPVFELSTITVTHYVPAETQIPFVNGKSTEYKTITTPSPSVEILAPHQYTQSDYLGKAVLVLNSEMTSTPSFGVTEITRFVIRESATTTVTFTPTTIRGRKTSFSHIIPSTVYSVEPVVSTITGITNPLQDNSQLTNLLLNQLLGQGFLNPNLLGLQQQQQSLLNINPNEPATPITQYNTKTTMYVTTVTDFTSTIVKITLHGKPLKSTIVESSTHVITATEFITESTVITPTQVIQQQPLTQQAQLQQAGQLNQLNPALIQSLLASQLLQQQQFLQQPIVPTQPVTLPLQTQQPQSIDKPKNIDSLKGNKDKEQFDQGEESMKDEKKVKVQTKTPEKPSSNGVPAGSTVITLYVSGKNPGEFSTVLQTVPIAESNRNKRSVADSNANPSTISPSRSHIDKSTSVLSIADSFVDSFDDFSDYEDAENADPMPVLDDLTLNKDRPFISFINDDNNLESSGTVFLEDSYSYSDPFTNLVTNGGRNSFNNGATESLESVLRDLSNLNSQSVSN